MPELLDTFARVLRDRGGRPLVGRIDEPCWSAMALDAWANRLVLRLDALSVPPGSPVVTALGNRAEFVGLVLACLRSNRPLVPADPGVTPHGVVALAGAFGAQAIVALPAMLPGESHPLAGHAELWVREDIEPREYPGTSILKVTSGSTGLPKAVLASADNLARDVEQIVAAMDIGADDVQLGTIPVSHAYGLGNLVLPALWQGTRVVLRDGFVPQRLPDDVRAFGVRVWPGVPFMFAHLIAHDGPPLPASLATLVSAGAPLLPAVVARFHERFARKVHSFYGTSETGGISFDGSDAVADCGVGTPLQHARVTLRPVEGLDGGEGGRVHVAGPAVARGYSAGTESADFCDGGFLTGDLGRFDATGRLTLAGRVSAFVNVAGRKVHPEEVAVHLRAMPGVRDVRVVGAPAASRGEQLVAILVPEGRAPSLLQIRRYCSARLPPYKIPRVLIVADAIPVDARGKTDRRRLEALVAAHVGSDCAS
jgi:acyl-CoA synthetase (AMP-forming)/AMP-acid ligase II